MRDQLVHRGLFSNQTELKFSITNQGGTQIFGLDLSLARAQLTDFKGAEPEEPKARLVFTSKKDPPHTMGILNHV